MLNETIPIVLVDVNGQLRRAPMQLTINYDIGTPTDINFTFTGYEDRPWSVRRKLLWQGLREKVNIGDLIMSPGTTNVFVTLSNNNVKATYRISRSKLHRFLARSYRLIPASIELSVKTTLGQFPINGKEGT